ncbi:MAG: Crp/Fnr family transcriptional regulator [Microbacteriaceae bacterium]
MSDNWSEGFEEILSDDHAVRPQAHRPEAPGASAPSFSCFSEVELFADLSPAEIETMDLMAPAQAYHRGDLVFSQSQPVTALFILKRGRVRIFRVTEDGKALTMGILEPGAVFGEMALIGQRMQDNYAEAIEDSAICRLGVQDVERFLLSDPRIAVRISRLLGARVARLEERLTDLAHRPLSARVARTLITLSDSGASSRFGSKRAVRITHEQLAGLVGATREATSKTMAELGAQQLIKQARGKVIILDRVALGATARRTA